MLEFECEKDAYWCGKCKARRTGTSKQIMPTKFADVVIITLKRFEFTSRGREKIRTNVDFPLKGLDLKEYL